MCDPLLERAEDRATIAQSVHAMIVRVTIGCAIVFIAFGVYYGVVAARGDGRAADILVLDFVSIACASGATVVLVRRPPDIVLSESIAFAIIALVTLDSTVTAWVFTDTRELFYISLLPLGLGAVTVRRWPWLVAAVLTGLVAIAAGQRIGDATADARAVSWITMTMVSSTVLAAAIHVGRRRSYTQIVELQRAERARAIRERELADQLRHVQKLDAIGTLAGGVAHDINNVLAAILGVAELGMEDHDPSSEVHAEFHDILTAAQRGAALTRNLLGFARRGKHRHEAVVLTRVVDEVLALLGRTAPRRIKLTRAFAEGIDTAAVMGDPSQLGQVVMNLCLNAIDAIPDAGSIVVGVRLCRLAERERATLAPGAYVCLAVRDTGGGMSAETLEHAFEPFYSTKTSTSQRGGSGLGLAMVYGTVRDHLGEVSLESELGAGTTATIYLPAVGVDAAAARRGAQARPSSPPLPELVKSRPVLVIDDEEMVRNVCTRMLRVHDVATQDADGGRAGLECFRAEPTRFSLVLLDLAMPEMTGAECFRALRAIDPAIPIVLMSGFPKDQSVEELLALGRATFLPKPFVRSALLEALARCRP